MTSASFLTISTLAYVAAWIVFVSHFCTRQKRLEDIGNYLVASAFLIHTAGMLLRWHEPYGFIRVQSPIGIPYEVFVVSSWVVAANFLHLFIRSKLNCTGVFTVPFAMMGMTLAEINKKSDIAAAWPSMDSNWPVYYVWSSSIAYAAFAIACSVSIMFIIISKYQNAGGNTLSIASSFPPAEILDCINRRKIRTGFVWLTLSLIIGAFWSNFAWGTFWAGTPLEIWSLLGWLIYFCAVWRSRREIEGVWASWQSIASFLVFIVIFAAFHQLFRVTVCY